MSAPTAADADLAVRAAEVGYAYRRSSQHALDRVCFGWPHGFTALLGPNGAGKSTLMSLLVGEHKVQRGALTVAAERVGYVPQQADWPGRFTVREFLTYAAWWQSVPRRRRPEQVAAALDQLGLGDLADVALRTLSGGQHRRAMIAQVLVSNPGLVVLDEPSAGLDPRQRVALREMLAGLAVERSVVVATHLVDDVETVADWVTMLDHGRVVFDASLAKVNERWGRDGEGRGREGRSALEAAYLDLVS